MNLQSKVLQTADRLRRQAVIIATAAWASAVDRAEVALKRATRLRGSVATLTDAGRELNKVTRAHTLRFIRDNSELARDAGKDISALARSTFVTLNRRAPAKVKTTRKPRSVSRASVRKKAA
jgi:hypothetical protein